MTFSVPFCCDVANLEYSLRYLSDAGSVINVIPFFLNSLEMSTGRRICSLMVFPLKYLVSYG